MLWGNHREERRPIALRRYLGDASNEEVYCELRYQGQLYDAETGLYYNRHRYYDAESRQYISPDPIGLGGGIRPQGYVHNPLEWVDPLGLNKKGPQGSSEVKPEPKLLENKSKTRFFKGDEGVKHFEKHGSEVMDALNRKSYNIKDYINDANHVVKNGQFVPEMNGYVKLIGGPGTAKYGFVGLDRATGNLTTFHVKSVSELMRKAPSLGITK